MLEKLKIKALYDDFVNKVKLTDEQKRILDMMLNKRGCNTIIMINNDNNNIL